MSYVGKRTSAFVLIEIILIFVLERTMVTALAVNVLFGDKNSVVSISDLCFYNTGAVTMLPAIPENALVIGKKSEIVNIRENSVILCSIGGRDVIIRVKQILEEEGRKYYIVKFDTYSSEKTFQIGSEAVIAKLVWQINGSALRVDFMTSTSGKIIMIIIPFIIIIAILKALILNIRRILCLV